MTSNDNVHQEVENLCKAGKWANVLKMYEEKGLRTAKITATGDTLLHMAVSSKKEHVVDSMVDLICGGKINDQDKKQSVSVSSVDENGDEKKFVLGIQNEKGNTPLHLAASIGNSEMCKKISSVDPLLIAIRNRAGETPLFMAALRGKRKAFLWLHYRYMETLGVSSIDIVHCIRRDNDDTILHCALEEGHIDVAIEIVHLYEGHLKEMIKHNKNELPPLRLLAETPSAFESNDLLDRSSVVQLLYRYVFRVKRKEHATTKGKLEQREREPRLEAFIDELFVYMDRIADYDEGSSWAMRTWSIILVLLLFLVILLLIPPALAEMLFHMIRNLKEEHTWSVQIVGKLLQNDSHEDMSADAYKKDSGPVSKIVDTPLMVAANNGIIEMVEKILEFFPSTIEVVNEDGKNIVLLAAEKRQTKLYKILRGNENNDKSLFGQVDENGNTALHSAARLGVHLNWQTTTMVEEFKWFEFVKRSVPSDLLEKYNKKGKTAEEIFRESYKEYMKSDRDWLNQTSQACSVASTLVASMAYSYIVAENFDEKNYPAIVALSLSLTSTISFLETCFPFSIS